MVLCRFQHCTGHIRTGSCKGRGSQYIQLVKVLCCKLLTNGKQLPAFPLEVGLGTELRSQRWEVRVLPLCHHGPLSMSNNTRYIYSHSFHNYAVRYKIWTMSKIQQIHSIVELDTISRYNKYLQYSKSTLW